jgi:hypothetical protein
MRLPADQTQTLRSLTAFLNQNCDTFYSAPASNSLHIYTRKPSLTGLTLNNSGLYNSSEQREIVGALNTAISEGDRVCIVREASGFPAWAASSTGRGPLGVAVGTFDRQVASIGNYSVWTR